MNARILTTAVMATVLCGVLPARAADSNLLNLMMPDAKVLAGVNVDQARTSPFGQWVLGQIQLQDIQKLKALTGFDPTQDVHEVLVGSNGSANQHNGLVAVRGASFDAALIAAAAVTNGATTEKYNGVTIIEDPQKQGGVAILSANYAVAGDLANVKAAIDRQSKTSNLSTAASLAVNKWSLSQDAWVITTVPPSSLAPKAGMPPIPGVGTSGANGQNNAFQGIKSAAAGVKFGANVVVTAEADAATADDAKQIGDAVKLLASLAQMQSNADPNLLALTKSLTTATNGSVLTISLSLPQDTLVQIVKNGNRAQHPAARRPMQKKQ